MSDQLMEQRADLVAAGVVMLDLAVAVVTQEAVVADMCVKVGAVAAVPTTPAPTRATQRGRTTPTAR